MLIITPISMRDHCFELIIAVHFKKKSRTLLPGMVPRSSISPSPNTARQPFSGFTPPHRQKMTKIAKPDPAPAQAKLPFSKRTKTAVATPPRRQATTPRRTFIFLKSSCQTLERVRSIFWHFIFFVNQSIN